MIDLVEVERQARNELANEKAKQAKTKIVSKLKDIEKAELVLKNLRREYEDLLDELSVQNS